MFRLSLILFFFMAIGHACTKNRGSGADVCGVKKPMQDIPWLKGKVDELKSQNLSGQVRRFRYQGSDIISIQTFIQSCYPCNLYTCFGQPLNRPVDSTIFKAIINDLDKLELVGDF